MFPLANASLHIAISRRFQAPRRAVRLFFRLCLQVPEDVCNFFPGFFGVIHGHMLAFFGASG